ncbi:MULTISPECIES: glycosyltransferase family 4 protein [Pseudoalteromonas]|uniref:Glycosyl transferase family 1 domain-containing protein n=1 Tax=Pseudoalteromonas amylolytica TaxID=1859457 RepID=A0A1S1MNX9_9GAMM|nr:MULTISPECIES: glycosyltransferase family 4 protein [Pseudoalteromonas]OHU84933.1 hypothetical protein BFC16_19785 [Pseudoalteromonas sp. JW3]OHU90116.1 hypothetical protein BET10_15190 [Pseudoalteromonas amylolytica]
MSKAKTVYLLSHEQPPMLGGAGVVALTMFDGLLAMGVRVKKNIAAIDLEARLARFAGLFFVLRAMFADVIILNDLYYKKLWLRLFRGHFCRRCIVYLHGSEPEFLIHDTRYRKAFLTMCMNAKRVVAVSDYMKEKLLDSITDQTYKAQIEKNITVIRNGIDTSCFQLQPKQNIYQGLTIITASRIVKEKGYIEVAQQIAQLRDMLAIPISWNIVGDGPFTNELKAYVKSLDMSHNVHFLGSLNHTELAKALNQADVFVLLSNLRESLGLVFMEASSCGCWSIGYNRFGAKEAIIPGETGSFVDSPEALPQAIVDFYSNPMKTRSQISTCAQAHFSSVNAVTQLHKTILGIEE